MPNPSFILKFTLFDPVRANVTKLGQDSVRSANNSSFFVNDKDSLFANPLKSI